MTITYTGVDGGGAYPNIIVGPSPGDLISAASVGLIAQGAANLTKRLYNMKVDRAGDTMTGALIVNAAAASSDAGVTGVGDGGASGGDFTGGSADGTGVEGTGGGSNGNGSSFRGTGVGTGVVAEGGSTGQGLYAKGNGGALAIQVADGNMGLTGTSPSSSSDPGFDDYICGANIIKAWVRLQTDGAGSKTIYDGYNIAEVSVGSSVITVTFARAFANDDFSAVVSADAVNPYWCVTGSRTTTTLEIKWVDDAGNTKNPSTSVLSVCLIAVGRQ